MHIIAIIDDSPMPALPPPTLSSHPFCSGARLVALVPSGGQLIPNPDFKGQVCRDDVGAWLGADRTWGALLWSGFREKSVGGIWTR
jgi:hypothetical protein